MQLLDETYDTIKALCAAGDRAQAADRFEDAIQHYKQAFALVPEPYTIWEASTGILVALGETYFFMSDFAQAAEHLKAAMHCPEAIGNPFIHLRLGQTQFELGNRERALDELLRAYMGEGDEIFADEDPKYLAFVKASVLPPPGGW